MSIPSSGSSTERSASKTSSRVGIGPSVPRQAVLGELVPRSARIDEGVVLGPDLRIAVQRTEANRDLVAVRPVAAEEARAAVRAEDLPRRPALGPEDAQQLLAREQPEPIARHPALREPERARVLAAEGAVAVIRPSERKVDLEPHASAQAASK